MRRSAAPIIAAVLLLLPVLYVGSYLTLVTPSGCEVNLYPKPYRLAESWCEKAYWPLEQIDRKLRPRAWESAHARFIENQIELFPRSPAKLQQPMSPEE